MEIKSYSKYMRISPKKAREVARILPGKKATEGVSILKFIPRKAARMFGKTLRSAMANAERRMSTLGVRTSGIQVDQTRTYS